MCTPCDRLEGREGTTQRVDEESAARTRKGKKRRKRMIEVSGGIQKKEAKRGEREKERGEKNIHGITLLDRVLEPILQIKSRSSSLRIVTLEWKRF